MELVKHYFPEFSNTQLELLKQYSVLLKDWNQKINLISRKNEDQIEEQHLLHALSIAKLIQFKPGAKVLDLGTGGGLPGIPLSIAFPDTAFHLVDSIQKKVKVVTNIKNQLRLNNVTTEQIRVEEHKSKYDFVVTRAVASSEKLLSWTNHLYINDHQHDFPNGLFALKGGDLQEELDQIETDYDIIPLTKFYRESFFETKKIIYYPNG